MTQNYLGTKISSPVEAWDYVLTKAKSNLMVRKFGFYDLYKNYRIKNENQEYSRIDKRVIKGAYILYEKETPVYVGISKDVINRIKQHCCGKTHNTASFVYLKTSIEQHYKGERSKWNDFDTYRIPLQVDMRNNWGFMFIEENDDTLLYLLEVCLAMELKTHWNSFHTH